MNDRPVIEPADRGIVGASRGGELLAVEDLTVSFDTPRGSVHAVQGLSFTLQRGRTIGIVGESGSGKSVTSKAIMGLLPRSGVTVGGTITYEGRDISSLSQDGYRELWGSELAMVFQDPMTSLNPVMKIGKQITESLQIKLGMDRQNAKETAIQLLTAVKIPAPEKRFGEYPGKLSGGMRQRVVIAMALACGPKLLFADEPTTALDVTVQAQILDLLAEQQRERHMAMILVSHDLGVVAGRTDEIMVMYGGRIVEHAPTSVLFGDVKMPYTEALLRSIPRIESPSHARLEAIPGRPPQLISPPKGCNFAPRCRYVQPRCLEEAPPLVAASDPSHRFRCWFPVGTPEGADALARNQAVGVAVSLPTGPPTGPDVDNVQTDPHGEEA